MTSRIARVAPLAAIAFAASAPGGGFAIEWSTVEGGGASSGSASWLVDASVGACDAGTVAGGAWSVSGGFWPVLALPPSAPCLGDLDGDGVVDGADLGLLLGDWGTTSASSDLDGSGLVDGGDLGLLLGAWGGCP